MAGPGFWESLKNSVSTGFDALRVIVRDVKHHPNNSSLVLNRRCELLGLAFIQMAPGGQARGSQRARGAPPPTRHARAVCGPFPTPEWSLWEKLFCAVLLKSFFFVTLSAYAGCLGRLQCAERGAEQNQVGDPPPQQHSPPALGAPADLP